MATATRAQSTFFVERQTDDRTRGVRRIKEEFGIAITKSVLMHRNMPMRIITVVRRHDEIFEFLQPACMAVQVRSISPPKGDFANKPFWLEGKTIECIQFPIRDASWFFALTAPSNRCLCRKFKLGRIVVSPRLAREHATYPPGVS
jgi:hypothetical protein